MPLLYADNINTELTTVVNVGATSFDVANPAGLPDPGPGEFFCLRLGTHLVNEVVICTGVSGNTVTCNSTSSAFSIGAEVKGTFSSRMLDELLKKNILFTDAYIGDYSEQLTSLSIVSGSVTVDIHTAGNNWQLTLTENVTSIVINNPPPSGRVGSFTWFFAQDATGGRTIAWPASFQWPNGAPPVIPDTADSKFTIAFVTRDGGAVYEAHLVGEFYA